MAELEPYVQKTKKLMCQELHGPALWRAMRPATDGDNGKQDGKSGKTIVPEVYYLAAGELLFIVLGVSWLITFIVKPPSPVNPAVSIIEDNALKRRIGYNNLCVGFDAAPAQYVAAFLWVFVAYLAMKFAWLDIERTELTRHKISNFKAYVSITVDVMYMLAFAGFMMVFVIHPWQNVWGHTIGFVFLALCQWGVLAANVLEAQSVPAMTWAFVAFYGIVTICDFGIILSNYVYYEQNGYGPWNKWWIGALFDYGWFGCLPLTSIFLPNAEGLKTTLQISEKIGKSEDSDDESGFMGCCGGEEEEDEEEIEMP